MMQTNRWGPDTCDCIIDYEWDDTLSDADRVHTVKQIVKRCEFHQALDDVTHYDTVLEENTRKNRAFGAIKEANSDADIAFEFNDKREVILNVKNVSFIDSEAILAKVGPKVQINLV